MINQDMFKGQWKEVKGAIRKKWGELTDNDLDQVQGDIEKLRGLIQKRYGQQKDVAERELEEVLRKFERVDRADH